MSKDYIEEIIEKKPLRPFIFRDPKLRLKAALETLEAFTKENSLDGIPPMPTLLKEGNGLGKIIEFAKDFLAEAFSPTIREKNEIERKKVESDVLKALDDIKRFHPIISQKQSEESKHLAKRALATIRNYNEVFDSEKTQNSSWHKKLLKFLIKRSQNGLCAQSMKLPENTKDVVFSLESKNTRLDKLRLILETQRITTNLTEREEDAFRMKAISLIKNQPILFPSIRDTLQAIRQTPIYSAITSEEKQGDNSEPYIITLEQTLMPFPGEIVILRGSFKRDPSSLTPTMPITDSFEMTTTSIQTGFPYPSQNNGWALANPLIPMQPLRPHDFGELIVLLEKKEQIALAFINKTSLLEKSRKLCQLKDEAAKANKNEFILLHFKLIKSIFKASPRKLVPSNATEAVNDFFSWLENQESPFSSLSNVYRQINTLHIEECCHTLKEIWMNESEKKLYDADPKKRFRAAKSILLDQIDCASRKAEKMEYSKGVRDFIHIFGKILGIGSANIFLQFFSESLECAPPQLSRFERALQSAALFQQENFIAELEEDEMDQNYIFTHLAKSLNSEIELFQSSENHHSMCRNIEKYYISRFVDSY
jgi:hypothetical protein